MKPKKLKVLYTKEMATNLSIQYGIDTSKELENALAHHLSVQIWCSSVYRELANSGYSSNYSEDSYNREMRKYATDYWAWDEDSRLEAKTILAGIGKFVVEEVIPQMEKWKEDVRGSSLGKRSGIL